ncbi:MAG: OB-fold domain-containing protein [Pseudomonadota bacterium]
MQVIAENLIDVKDQKPVLYGGQSLETGDWVFPYPNGPESERYKKVKLKDRGKLWSYTIQRFPPKNPPFIGENEPGKFDPYAVGYVELEGQLIVEARLVVGDFEQLAIGQEMALTTVAFASDANGTPLFTYAFEPI